MCEQEQEPPLGSKVAGRACHLYAPVVNMIIPRYQSYPVARGDNDYYMRMCDEKGIR